MHPRLALIVIALLLCCTGCTSASFGQPIGYTTIDEGMSLRHLQDSDPIPRIIPLGSLHDVDALAGRPEFIPSPSIIMDNLNQFFTKLRAVNYQERVAVVILRGMVGASKYNITVHDVRTDGQTVNISVTLNTPDQWYDPWLGIHRVVEPATFDWYTVITFPKQRFQGRPTTFKLISDNDVIYQETINIP